MNNQKAIDLRYGFKSENEIHSYLEQYFGELKKSEEDPTKGKYYEFDKFNDNYFIELKTRRINHNRYSTLMFGYNKYKKGEELKKENPSLRIFYCFRCLDGTYYWEHDSSIYQVALSGRCDRGKYEYHDCVHIKTEHLKKLEGDASSFSL